MKNNLTMSLTKEFLKLILLIIVSTFFWLVLFTLFQSNEDKVIEPFSGAFVTFGIITSLIISTTAKYNKLHNLLQKTKSERSNVKVFEKRSKILLEKANKVAKKYMDFESNTQLSVAKNRTTKTEIDNSASFKMAIEDYPNLKANDSVMTLLKQIEDCENSLAEQKIKFNYAVETYNYTINTFPDSILSKIFKFKEIEFYNEVAEDGVISDEKLGI